MLQYITDNSDKECKRPLGEFRGIAPKLLEGQDAQEWVNQQRQTACIEMPTANYKPVGCEAQQRKALKISIIKMRYGLRCFSIIIN